MTLLAEGATVGPENHQAWLATRRSGIGASEIAAVLGICPYTTPRELYLRKTGQLPDRDETEGMRRGRHMESFLAAEYRRRFPDADLTEQLYVRHLEYRHLFATLDAIHRDGQTIVEFKTASGRNAAQWGAEETDEVPDSYLCQVQHQLLVSGAQVAHVFASIGGEDCKLFVVPRREFIIHQIIEQAAKFWRCVEMRDAPPPSRAADARWNPWVYPEPEGAIQLSEIDEELVRLWIDAKETRAKAEEDADRYRAGILEALGHAEVGYLPGDQMVSRKVVHRAGGTYTRKDSTFTDLRIKKSRRHDG